MSLAAMLGQTVTVVRYDDGGKTPYGNAERVEVSRSDVAARLRQTGSAEDGADRDLVVDRWTLYLEPSVGIGAGDEVLHGTRRFTVEGTPDVVETPRGPHHIKVRLQYVGDVP